MIYDLIIIGGGVVGCATAREASKFKIKTLLIEKEPDVAEGISKANSGVLHAGFNVRPDSLKALYNIEGLKLCPGIAEELDVNYRITGKLVVGKTEKDLRYLKKLFEQGKKNGCSGLQIIGKQRINEIQPGLSAEWALLSESTGIISPFMLTIALAENAAANGVEFRLNTAVSGISRLPDGIFIIKTADGKSVQGRMIINSAGIDAAGIKSMIEPHATKVFPCRGEYYITDKLDGDFLNLPVYPVPPADGSGLGVHLTPTCNGNILIGPSADYINDPADTSNSRSIMELLKTEAAELLPSLRGASFIKNYSGNRPKLFEKNSEQSFADFIIEESEQYPGMINLIGIESPGLTSAPAIAKYIIGELVGNRTNLPPNTAYNPRRQGIIRTSQLSESELKGLVEMKPEYSGIICRCEQISRAEILEAIHNPLGAVSLNAVKKRTYSMMGRCQSGFCLPKIIDIICEETGLRPEEILKSTAGSEVLKGRLK